MSAVFEPGSSATGGDRSANCATTTARHFRTFTVSYLVRFYSAAFDAVPFSTYSILQLTLNIRYVPTYTLTMYLCTHWLLGIYLRTHWLLGMYLRTHWLLGMYQRTHWLLGMYLRTHWILGMYLRTHWILGMYLRTQKGYFQLLPFALIKRGKTRIHTIFPIRTSLDTFR